MTKKMKHIPIRIYNCHDLTGVHFESYYSCSRSTPENYPHLFGRGGSLGHVQGTASHANGGGGGEGSGRADEKRCNRKLHLDTIFLFQDGSKESEVTIGMVKMAFN